MVKQYYSNKNVKEEKKKKQFKKGCNLKNLLFKICDIVISLTHFYNMKYEVMVSMGLTYNIHSQFKKKE